MNFPLPGMAVGATVGVDVGPDVAVDVAADGTVDVGATAVYVAVGAGVLVGTGVDVRVGVFVGVLVLGALPGIWGGTSTLPFGPTTGAASTSLGDSVSGSSNAVLAVKTSSNESQLALVCCIRKSMALCVSPTLLPVSGSQSGPLQVGEFSAHVLGNEPGQDAVLHVVVALEQAVSEDPYVAVSP